MVRFARPLFAALAVFCAVLLGRALSGGPDPGAGEPGSPAPSLAGPADRASVAPPAGTVQASDPEAPAGRAAEEEKAGSAPTTAVEIRLDEFGEPLAGVELVLSGTGVSRRGKTDPHGVYRVDLPEGEYRLEIPSRELVTAVRATGVADATVELRIPGRAALAGRIVDSESLAPVAEAWVEVYPQGWDGEEPAYHRMGWTQTDASGRFRIEGLPERPILAIATKRTHSPWREVLLPSEDREVRLVPLGGFRILVTDAAGQPAGLVPVEVGIRGSGGFDEAWEALADDGGRIVVTDLASGPYRVRLRIEGGEWSEERNVFAAPGEDLPVEFRVHSRIETER